MRILHLSTFDITGGGSRAAYRLHKGLQQLGESSQLFVLDRRSDDPSVVVHVPPNDFLNRLLRWRRRRRIAADFRRYTQPVTLAPFTDDRTVYGSHLLTQLPAADIINLHWVARMVDYGAFFPAVPRRTPVVWRLADMVPITGGCHYDSGCGRFTQKCGRCPQLSSQNEEDLSREIWQRKSTALSKVMREQLCLVAPSHWMANKIRESSIFSRFPVTVIPNGFDLDALAPRNRQFARNILGIPTDARVVLFAANHVNNRRKGLSHLVAALSGMREVDGLFLLSVGQGNPAHDLGLPGRHFRHIDEYRFLSVIYSAADVFVVTSLEDNFPNTAAEATACGTPVIAFDVGGIRDIVRPGETGELVRVGDTEALRSTLLAILTNSERIAAMSHSCREIAVKDFSLESQARRYLDLYREMVAHHPDRPGSLRCGGRSENSPYQSGP